MTRDDYGVWEITVPALPQGECAIPHDSKVKVSAHMMYRASLQRTHQMD